MIHQGPREVADGIADDIRLREVTPADAVDLYRWRMEPATRTQFRGVDEVPFAAHQAYLARYFAVANTDRWFVIEAAGEPVGAIALYDLSPDGAEAEWGGSCSTPSGAGEAGDGGASSC